jgi:RND superfamily putative drug exporter
LPWRRLSEVGTRRPRAVVLATLSFFAVAVVIGGPLPDLLPFSRAFDDPGSESARARSTVEKASGAAFSGGIVALVEAPPGSPQVRRIVTTLRGYDSIARVVVPTSGNRSAAVSRNGQATLVEASLRAAVIPETAVEEIVERFRGQPGVFLGGGDIARAQITEQATEDLTRAEMLAFPLLALLSLLVFRGVAALLPIVIGGLTIPSTFMILRGVNEIVGLSPFALNLVVGLGLGLAVDYSLFLVWRLREELAQDPDLERAVRVTADTAGRTVTWSAATVAAALVCLIVFPQRFLVSMGIGGALVALVAALAALIVLPALFVLLGPRLGKVRPRPAEEGHWYRLAKRLMRRPGYVAVGVTAVMLILATPALRTAWSGVDADALPPEKSARILVDRIPREFPATDIDPIHVVVTAPSAARAPVKRLASELARLPGAAGASAPQLLGKSVWQVDLYVRGDASGSVAQHLVSKARQLPSAYPVAVGGVAAEFQDLGAAISRTLPVAFALLVALTLVILWLMTGSVLLPLKTLLMNLLTTAAATGLLVLIFQDGNLEGLLDFQSDGGLEQTSFVVFVALVFALSTDYGVFLLTRIQECRDSGLPNDEAVAIGLQHAGGIVTAAAVLLAVALGALATSETIFLKELGVGAACAVLLDAWIVRGFLVPALMALLGEWNWWAPPFLRRMRRKEKLR